MPYITHSSRRKALNQNQIQVLSTLYRFRFGTTDLLAATATRPVGRRYMNTRLKILCDQGFIGRRYEHSYKLQGKFASYYLLPKGIAVLKQWPDKFNPQMLKNIRNDQNAAERSVGHWINVFQTYITLKDKYGASLKFFTKSHLRGYDYFPKPLPDAFIVVETTDGPHRCFLECFDGTMPEKIMKERIGQLISYVEDGDWPREFPYPAVLLLCSTERLQKKTHGWVRKALAETWCENLNVRAIALQELKEATI